MGNKYAVVTGGSRGIGYGVAEFLASQGYNLVLVAKSQLTLERAAENLRAQFSDVNIIHKVIDLSNAEQAYNIVAELLIDIPRLDVLFNNAGVLVPGADELTYSVFHKMIQVNVEGLFSVAKAALEKMVTHKSGYLFNLSSLSGIRAFPETAGYAATKFAVTGLTEGLYKKYKAMGINITAICPGVVNTEMTQHFDMPIEKKIQVSDIVKTVDYLLSLSPTAVMPKIEIHCRDF